MKSDIFVSIIIVVRNQTSQLINYLDNLCPYLSKVLDDYEIIIIDQNSDDEIENRLPHTLSKHQSIRHIRLTQEESHDVALAAGLENSIGDFVINLNIAADSINIIMPLVQCGLSGNDIVICTSKQSTSFLYKKIKKLFSSVLKSIGYTLPNDSTGTFCFSRRSVNALTESGRFYCKLHMRIANIGYSLKSFNSDGFTRISKKKSIILGIKESIHHMVFNSTKPLRWMSFLGVVGSVTAMLFSLYCILVHLFNDNVVSGWTTTILFMSTLFSILFIILSFFGEYLARLLNDRSEHKEYNVIYERNSSVMLNEERENVIFSSKLQSKNNTKTGRKK